MNSLGEMLMLRISNTQLFMLIMIFQVGSTTLFALGIGAGRDAWIVILLAALIGFMFLGVFTEIPKQYPEKNFPDILKEVVGKKIAVFILFSYALYFYGQTHHNFYEFGRLIKITALPLTPINANLVSILVLLSFISFIWGLKY
jgi:spore germination protein KB